MKKICLLLAVLICIASLLVGCTDKQGTEKLRNDFIGETFLGGDSHSTGSHQYEIRSYTEYRFVFTDEDTVSLTKTVTTKYGDAYNESDTEEETTKNLAYAVKKTQSGKSYIFIQGFGSDGIDTSNNEDGLEVVFDESGEIDYFIYDALFGKIKMYKI